MRRTLILTALYFFFGCGREAVPSLGESDRASTTNGSLNGMSMASNCAAPVAYCGDGICNGGETSYTCPDDCGDPAASCIGKGCYTF